MTERDPLAIAGEDAAVVFPELEPAPGDALTREEAEELRAEAVALISKEPPPDIGGGS